MSQRPDPLRQAAEEPFNNRMIRHCCFSSAPFRRFGLGAAFRASNGA